MHRPAAGPLPLYFVGAATRSSARHLGATCIGGAVAWWVIPGLLCRARVDEFTRGHGVPRWSLPTCAIPMCVQRGVVQCRCRRSGLLDVTLRSHLQRSSLAQSDAVRRTPRFNLTSARKRPRGTPRRLGAASTPRITVSTLSHHRRCRDRHTEDRASASLLRR